MGNVLIDTCVLLAAYERLDSTNRRALEDLRLLQKNQCKIWLTEHILDELLTILLKRGLRMALQDVQKKIKLKQFFVFTPQTTLDLRNLRNSVMNRLVSQNEKASFTDIYSMVVVEEGYLDNTKILSYDHHFKKPLLWKR
jgi:predicted nucleic acid-binding protein